jgi:hypothetical protein
MRQSGVCAEKQVLPRPVRDMETEKAQELMRLGVGDAYLNGRQSGVQIVRKFRTEKLEHRFQVRATPAQIERDVFENGLMLGYLRRRQDVEQELEKGQQQWQIRPPEPTKPRHGRPKGSGQPPPAWG